MVDFLKKFFDIKFWKFILVGIINTIVGNGIMFILYNLTPLSDMHRIIFSSEFDLGWWLSSFIGYVIGSVVSFILNRRFTFNNQGPLAKTIFKFALNIAVCYFLAYSIAQPLAERLLSGMNLDEKLVGNIALLFGMGLFTLFNYIGQRFFAFRDKDEAKSDTK